MPTAWNTLHSTNSVRKSEKETIRALDVRRSIFPCVLGDLFIRVRRSQRLPWSNNKPLPGFSGDESFGLFDGSNHRSDVEVGGQEIGVDNRRVERVRSL